MLIDKEDNFSELEYEVIEDFKLIEVMKEADESEIVSEVSIMKLLVVK